MPRSLHLWYGPHDFGVVTMPLTWSQCLWHSLYAIGIVSMPLAWSPSLWHSLHTFDMVTRLLAWSPCFWHGPHTFGMVPKFLTGSPCLWHGHHAFGIVSMPPALLLCYCSHILHFWVFLRFLRFSQLRLCNFATAKPATREYSGWS